MEVSVLQRKDFSILARNIFAMCCTLPLELAFEFPRAAPLGPRAAHTVLRPRVPGLHWDPTARPSPEVPNQPQAVAQELGGWGTAVRDRYNRRAGTLMETVYRPGPLIVLIFKVFSLERDGVSLQNC